MEDSQELSFWGIASSSTVRTLQFSDFTKRVKKEVKRPITHKELEAAWNKLSSLKLNSEIENAISSMQNPLEFENKKIDLVCMFDNKKNDLTENDSNGVRPQMD